MTLPITKRDDKVKEPGDEPSPILVGRNNALVQQLVKIGKTRLDDLQPGEGEVQIVPRAFGNATATVVAGADPAGTLAASRYLAGRAPYLWDVRARRPDLRGPGHARSRRSWRPRAAPGRPARRPSN